MMTMSQVVHGTAPAATGDGRRATVESHGAAGTPLQAPNNKGLIRRRTPEERCGDKSLYPTMPQADLSEMWGEGTPHQGMYLEGGVCWGYGSSFSLAMLRPGIQLRNT